MSAGVLPREAFRFAPRDQVWLDDGRVGLVIARLAAADCQRPYCVVTDGEHAEQLWLAERDLSPVLPVVAVERGELVEGWTAGGLRWHGSMTRRRGVRVVEVTLTDRPRWGLTCQWDPSPTRRLSRHPRRADLQRMADDAERRGVDAGWA